VEVRPGEVVAGAQIGRVSPRRPAEPERTKGYVQSHMDRASLVGLDLDRGPQGGLDPLIRDIELRASPNDVKRRGLGERVTRKDRSRRHRDLDDLEVRMPKHRPESHRAFECSQAFWEQLANRVPVEGESLLSGIPRKLGSSELLLDVLRRLEGSGGLRIGEISRLPISKSLDQRLLGIDRTVGGRVHPDRRIDVAKGDARVRIDHGCCSVVGSCPTGQKGPGYQSHQETSISPQTGFRFNHLDALPVLMRAEGARARID
jgi:hypothetical protein